MDQPPPITGGFSAPLRRWLLLVIIFSGTLLLLNLCRQSSMHIRYPGNLTAWRIVSAVLFQVAFPALPLLVSAFFLRWGPMAAAFRLCRGTVLLTIVLMVALSAVQLVLLRGRIAKGPVPIIVIARVVAWFLITLGLLVAIYLSRPGPQRALLANLGMAAYFFFYTILGLAHHLLNLEAFQLLLKHDLFYGIILTLIRMTAILLFAWTVLCLVAYRAECRER